MSHTGPVGTIARPASGTLDATNPTVLVRIDSRLVAYLTSKGLTGVTAICNGTSSTTASCKVTGTNSAGQASSAVLTVTLNPATRLLKIVHVSF
jgi:hypothetical protein